MWVTAQPFCRLKSLFSSAGNEKMRRRRMSTPVLVNDNGFMLALLDVRPSQSAVCGRLHGVQFRKGTVKDSSAMPGGVVLFPVEKQVLRPQRTGAIVALDQEQFSNSLLFNT